MAKEPPLTLRVMPEALGDLLAIRDWNAVEYGDAHADKYVASLRQAFVKLSRSPRLGQLTLEIPNLRRFLVQKRSRHYGHFIFYRVVAGELQILRIYHTAQDWPTRIRKDLKE